MNLDLEAIKARCEAATPGPWKRWRGDVGDRYEVIITQLVGGNGERVMHLSGGFGHPNTVDEDWPCNRHLLDAYTSAAASSSAAGGSAAASAELDGAAGLPPGSPTAGVAGGSTVCRFAAFDWHRCRRRDGRPCGPEDCHSEHRAQMRDVTELSAEIDAIPLVSWLLGRRDEWEDA